ncbi:S-layer homology domain-containing protein [Pelotomaculum terephthalicicum JT]|uniref:S-layer homology domain-containing protein n=1 Tax=Pelotomaculum TaxID=191373 RepID=UPI0009CBE802|nr:MULTISPECIES: S-layer homology domain-containing protein [Pelotomaculum]MCG9966447.1 S-layer homology domain-containing protein [Pelotomaculum terephthalicicum JT]OPX89901.1 MAG: Endo-1,4-beta-xylanase A precursor [Pelotomaculum sp. PtaB.Bin117]
MKMIMRVTLSLLTVAILFCLVTASADAGVLPVRGSFFSVQSRQMETVGEGVALIDYSLDLQGDPVRMAVLQVDLKNPYVKIEGLIGSDGTLESTQQVSKMAERSGAVAAINAGFFIMAQGKPLGMIVKDGKLVSSPIIRDDMPVFALGMDGRPLMDFFQFNGEVKAGNGAVFPLFGVNKPLYNMEYGGLSDTDHLTLYDRNWGQYSRGGNDELPGAVEIVVENNVATKQVVAGAPLPIPANGYILWGHGAAADFMSENMPVGSRVKVSYQTTPAFEKIEVSTGSNSFLVQGGKVAAFQEELKGNNSRTAVASSDSGRFLYLVAVEKSSRSRGLEQEELAELLVAMGVETALNLDGGGSTTMVAKHLGDTDISNIVQPKEGWQRPVTDGLGIFNTAPPGEPAGLIINGPDVVLAGTDSSYTVKGYDTHFYPWQPQNLSWRANGGGNAVNGIFSAGSGGDVVIEVTSGTVKGTKKVHVIGSDEIKALQVEPAVIKAGSGQPVTLTFSILTRDGQVLPLEARYVTVHASTGTVNNGIFYPGKDDGKGVLAASYQGLTVQVPIRAASLFKDTVDNWAEEQINELAESGIIKGYEDGTYRPAEPVTRAQIVALLARLQQWPPGEEQPNFKDKVPDWARDAVAAAVARGVVSGYADRTFQPDRPVTRAEVSVILDHAINFAGKETGLDFKDAGIVPDWARASMARVVSAGIIRGYEDGSLKPGANLTRAEIAVLITRLIELNYVKVEQ